ncbi:MAG: LamG-like jellyroll fold domain-containing protein, partial [Elusimicrobiota bacterium]
ATSDGAALRLYRNGVLASSAAATGTPLVSTGTLQLGASRFGESFNGKLDDARMYNRALSAAEVLAVFNAAPPSGTLTDLNGDGITNVADVQIAVNQAVGASACGSGDVNKDGACNVSDIQLVINKALGL